LTLIDSLSTLAILASAPLDKAGTGAKALRDFQDGISALVVQYGDGTDGTSGQGLRSRGLDSKVQVFETVIRGVGGLLSAHLFASGELPIKGYKPVRGTRKPWKSPQREVYPPILWPNGFKYDGQLLRLALDLAQRLLPAFYTNTGMPYPRVNLRHGIPFYQNSPLNQDSETGECAADGAQEITETCSAGAGSLVLEFTVLSRLTGDPRFEQLAKRAFWAVWSRRSPIGLIGAGVDAEVGHWVGPYSGIGAGTDSFFEYALKTHILLSGHDTPNNTVPSKKRNARWLDPNTIYNPLSEEENSSESFLRAWQDAHAAIKRHLYSNTHHPHYVNVHLGTGSPQAYWIDSLGAYYPGLLTLAGELEEAIETNLLYTALWTRYSALPERWSVRDGHVEGGLGWWPGRPEFIESNYHIYRATKDPWYLYVGEMVLKDIKRRCWTACGWAGLQDVRTGEKNDRMESFFLGETAKYMYLLFDPEHPLNTLDAPYVFTTEGHPLIIPGKIDPRRKRRQRSRNKAMQPYSPRDRDTCPVPPASIPLTISATASRADLFHAASLIGLHHIPNFHALDNPSSTNGNPGSRVLEPNAYPNHTYYPWTLPTNLVPANITCARLPIKATFNIEFPSNTQLPTPPSGFNIVLGPQGLVRINSEGILVKSLQGVKLGMVEEEPSPMNDPDGIPYHRSWRVWNIGNMALGRDEKVFVKREVIGPMNDPSFTRVRDSIMLDIVLQIENVVEANLTESDPLNPSILEEAVNIEDGDLQLKQKIIEATGIAAEYRTMLSSLLHHVTSALRDPVATLAPRPQLISSYHFQTLAAVAPVGVGAAPLPDVDEAPDPTGPSSDEKLSWTNVFFAGEACHARLPEAAVKYHQVIVIKRGGCTFSSKLANIPSFTPSARGFRFLIIVSTKENEDEEGSKLVRPLLDEPQYTPSGLLRHHQISMALVSGGDDVYGLLKTARSLGIRRRYHVESQGIPISNLIVV
jgi:Glycosyl hydrolase family 47